MTPKKSQVQTPADVSKLQSEINNLVTKRLDRLTVISKQEDSITQMKGMVKSNKVELNNIDKMLKEKLEDIQKIRNG